MSRMGGVQPSKGNIFPLDIISIILTLTAGFLLVNVAVAAAPYDISLSLRALISLTFMILGLVFYVAIIGKPSVVLLIDPKELVSLLFFTGFSFIAVLALNLGVIFVSSGPVSTLSIVQASIVPSFYFSAGASEEVLFRFFLMSFLLGIGGFGTAQSMRGIIHISSFVTSFLFDAYHGTVYHDNLPALIIVFGVSMVLCYTFAYTRRLSIVQATHGLGNYIAAQAALLTGRSALVLPEFYSRVIWLILSLFKIIGV